MTEAGERVQLFVYDLTMGMARMLSPSLLGQQVRVVADIWNDLKTTL